MLDRQWLQQLMSYGLLPGAFRPQEEICVLRAMFSATGQAPYKCRRLQRTTATRRSADITAVCLPASAGPTIRATAHKFARLIYGLMIKGEAHVDQGQDYFEKRHQKRVMRNLKKRCSPMGFSLTPIEAAAA